MANKKRSIQEQIELLEKAQVKFGYDKHRQNQIDKLRSQNENGFLSARMNAHSPEAR